MKKEKVYYDLDIHESDDYKMAHVKQESLRELESIDGWVYIGANAANPRAAKLGITTGNLASRSYSSGNPDFFIFCAFKCKHNISPEMLVSIEKKLLLKFDEIYVDENGTSKRKRHYETGKLSEWYYEVDFIEFFLRVNYELYERFQHSFVVGDFYEGVGDEEFTHKVGDTLDCMFNRRIPEEQKRKYRRMLVQ